MDIIMTTLLILGSVLLGWSIFSLGLYITFKYSDVIDNKIEQILNKISFIKRFKEEA